MRAWSVVGGAAAVLAAGGAWLALRGNRAAAPAGELCGSGARACVVPLAVKWSGGPEVSFAPALLEVDGDGLRLSISGKVTASGKNELAELKLEAHLLDRDGATVGALGVDAQPSFAPPLRVGDSATFVSSAKVPPATRQLVVTPQSSRTTAAPDVHAAPTPIDVSVEPAPGAPISIAAAYRKRQVRVLAGETAVEGVLEVENHGSAALRALELDLRALGADGRPVGDAAHAVVAEARVMPMLPGERRLVRFHLHAPGTIAGERLVVTRVE
jgi:hypothetical protein